MRLTGNDYFAASPVTTKNDYMKDFFFSYFYYRITQVYFKWDKRNSITAVLAITMLQSMLIFDVFILTFVLSYYKGQGQLYPTFFNYLLVVFFVALTIYNYKKYYNKFSFYKNKWKDENKMTRFLKGLLVLICLILPWILIFVVGNIKIIFN
jgi:hypothetical protein